MSAQRIDTIYLAHADDPTYIVPFPVIQDMYSNIPPFRYFVLKFTWAGGDVDIAVEFAGNTMPATGVAVPFDNNYSQTPFTSYSKAMGYNLAGSIDVNGNRWPTSAISFSALDLEGRLMFWGGDAMGGQGETVFFNAPQITPVNPRLDTSGLPRYINLEVYNTRWTTGTSPYPVTTTISTYEGGYMRKPSGTITDPSTNTYNFYNVNGYNDNPGLIGTIKNPADWTVTRTNWVIQSQSTTTFRSSFEHIATITYDRYTRGANIEWHATEY